MILNNNNKAGQIFFTELFFNQIKKVTFGKPFLNLTPQPNIDHNTPRDKGLRHNGGGLRINRLHDILKDIGVDYL